MPRQNIITKMKFISFGSGSSGNCYYLLEDGFGLVIDQGIGIRSFKRYFRDYGLSQGEISAILVTHDHTDHVKAVGAISQEYHLPVYAAGKVHEGMENNYLMSKKIAENNKRVLMPGEKIVLGPFTITAFEVPHDASANNGYFITTNSTNFCLMTDCGKITVSMKTTDDQMILSISDQGLGIPKQDLPRIFDRFYRVDRARSRAQGGTGLGLSIAKEIIKQHNGFIWAKSEYGKGSTFTIVLPYDKDAVKEEVWEDEVED